jgi:hypothetical protein
VQAGTVKTVILAIFNLESVVLMVEFFCCPVDRLIVFLLRVFALAWFMKVVKSTIKLVDSQAKLGICRTMVEQTTADELLTSSRHQNRHT